MSIMAILIILFMCYGFISNDDQKPNFCTTVSTVTQNGNWSIIGFFPVRNEFPSYLLPNGILRAEVMKYVIAEYNEKIGRNLIGYTLYDTCSAYEFDVTTEAMMDVTLSNYNAESDKKQQGCICTQKNKYLENTLGIVGATLSSKSIYMNKILSQQDLPMVSYASTSPELSDSYRYPNFYRTILSDQFQARFIADVLIAFSWTYVSIISQDDSYGRAGVAALNESLSLCFNIQASTNLPLNEEYIGNVMEKLRDDSLSNVIILWGSLNLIKNILMYAERYKVHRKIWIISEASGRNNWFLSSENKLDGSFLIIVPSSGKYPSFENYFFNIRYNDTENNPWLRSFFHTKGVNSSHNKEKSLREYKSSFELNSVGLVRNAVLTYIDSFIRYINHAVECNITQAACNLPPISNRKSFTDTYIQATSFKGLMNETIEFDDNGDIQTGAFDLYIATQHVDEFYLAATWSVTGGLTLHRDLFNLNISKTESQCHEVCSPGFYPIMHGTKQCCWKCIECPDSSIKENHSLKMCVKCERDHIANENRTSCIPLVGNHITFNSSEAYCIYAISSFGVLTTLLIIITFLTARQTPVVRSSNLNQSLAQLLGNLLIFLLPYLYFEKETKLKCEIRVVAGGVLFSFILGITLSKVTHILTVFSLKYRLSARELINLRIKEFTIVTVAVVVDIMLIIILLKIRPIKILPLRDVYTHRIYKNCNTELHYLVIESYLLFLQVICSIQAFRGRKLPASYNETKYIAFAMFTSTLTMAIAIPLSDQAAKAKLVISIIIMVANFSIMLSLYLYKIVIIWFYPEKNNTQQFNRERIKSIRADMDRRYSAFSVDTIYEATIQNVHLNHLKDGQINIRDFMKSNLNIPQETSQPLVIRNTWIESSFTDDGSRIDSSVETKSNTDGWEVICESNYKCDMVSESDSKHNSILDKHSNLPPILLQNNYLVCDI